MNTNHLVGRRSWQTGLLAAIFGFASVGLGHARADFYEQGGPSSGGGVKISPRKRLPTTPPDEEAVAKADRLYNEMTMPLRDPDKPQRRVWGILVGLAIAAGLVGAGYYAFRARPNAPG